jgi:hypothetical protein
MVLSYLQAFAFTHRFLLAAFTNLGYQLIGFSPRFNIKVAMLHIGGDAVTTTPVGSDLSFLGYFLSLT